MRRKPVFTCLLGCAALPVGLIVTSVAAAGWMYFSVPIDTDAGHDGSTADTALIVEEDDELDAINAEYAWLLTRHPWDAVIAQSLVLDGDRAYDVFTLQTPDGEAYDLHFDITDSYGNWR